MGIEKSLETVDRWLPGFWLKLPTALTSRHASGGQWSRTWADSKSSTPVITMSCP